jgi:quercetin dioxygenase-like cupin family protein
MAYDYTRAGNGANAKSEVMGSRHSASWTGKACRGSLCAKGSCASAFSGADVTVALHKLMPKHEPKPHEHAHEQIVYIIAGRIRFHVC